METLTVLPVSRLTPKSVRAVIDARRQGKPGHECAKAGGMSFTTLKRYLERAREGEPAFSEFGKAYERAYCEWVEDRTKAISAEILKQRASS